MCVYLKTLQHNIQQNCDASHHQYYPINIQASLCWDYESRLLPENQLRSFVKTMSRISTELMIQKFNKHTQMHRPWRKGIQESFCINMANIRGQMHLLLITNTVKISHELLQLLLSVYSLLLHRSEELPENRLKYLTSHLISNLSVTNLW